MRILVTGGSGFVGKKLSILLKSMGHDVFIIDFKNTSLDVEYYNLDISDPNFLNIDFKSIDIIYHIAAQSGGYFSLVEPYKDCSWNAVGTMNIVKLAEKYKVKKIIYTSSMAVYGNRRNALEADTPQPISFYGVSKLSAEYYVQLMKHFHDIPFTIFRLFATYGSGQDLTNKHQGILSIYLSQALEGNTVTITGKKNRVRELVHVDDVLNALLLGLNSSTDNEIFNVTKNEKVTPEIIISKISNRLNKDLEINEVDGYVGDQTFITGSNQKLKDLGWSPKYNLDKGINEFINFLKL